MDNEMSELIRQRSDYKARREEKYKQDSRDRLATILKKKVQTTMIGALSSIEDHFGFLWDVEEGEEPTNEQKLMQELYQKVRSEILDKGNTQARNIDVELANHEVEWKRFSLKLPVKPIKEQ